MFEAAAFGKVAVLYGGESSEREISLVSGTAVHKALVEVGIDAHLVDTKDHHAVWALKEHHFDRAFIILHGRGGEDGEIQAVLQWLGLPYTGSRVMACALAMDKMMTKRVWKTCGLPVLPDVLVSTDSRYDEIAATLQCEDFVVKPALEGSSVGVSRVSNQAQLEKAIVFAGGKHEKIMAEPWIVGRELTYGVVNGQALAGIEIVAGKDHAFYDFHAKYQAENTAYLCPAPIDAQLEAQCQQLALTAFESIDACGWGRVDFMLDQNNQPYLLEINLAPGMTSHSLVPMAAKHAGMDFGTLVQTILAQTLISG